MAFSYSAKFHDALAGLKREGRYRVFTDIVRARGDYPHADLHTQGARRPVTVWCSNDYLGMGQHPKVVAAMHEAIDETGAGAGGTRNISGNTHYHVELEAELADLHGKEAALLFTSGFVSNDATLATLAKLLPGLIVYSDALNHASMIEGIRHGGMEKRIFRHNDMADLEAQLAEAPPQAPKLIAFESVYSMDGDFAQYRRYLRSGRQIRRLDLYRRSPWRRSLWPPRRRRGRARRRHAPHRHRRRHAGQGFRRHGRLYCGLRRDRGLHPLLRAGLHFHHLPGADHRRRCPGERAPSEGERCRARKAAGARRAAEARPGRGGSAGHGVAQPYRAGLRRRCGPVQGGVGRVALRPRRSMCSRSTSPPCRAAPNGCASRHRRSTPMR